MALVAGMSATANAQQAVDPDFVASVEHPEYKAERGPIVMIDEAHFNVHTASGGHKPFASVLSLDGFRVRPFKERVSARALKGVDVLVISNASSAFSDDEVREVHDWVRRGGALLLIVDHMPAPGAIETLASAFGAQWSNGYAQDPKSGGLIVFKRSDGSLGEHAITNGRNSAERIDQVTTFAGSAFQASGAQSLLTFKGEAVSWLPTSVGKLVSGTPSISVKGWQQGAVLTLGRGRVALFGEAAMFTAQRVGPNQEAMGMNARNAPQNQQFLLNVMHWLTGSL